MVGLALVLRVEGGTFASARLPNDVSRFLLACGCDGFLVGGKGLHR